MCVVIRSDFRLIGQPRFGADAIDANLKLVDGVAALAEAKGCTVGQLALAWLTAQGADVTPIPGTTKIAHLDTNLAARAIRLTPAELATIDAIFTPDAVVGSRYAHMAMTFHGNKQ